MLLFSVIPLQAQETPAAAAAPRNPQSLLLLQRSLSALIGTASAKDVTLSGNVRRIAGSDDETGSITLKATVAGQARIDLSLPSGQRSEVMDTSQAAPTGRWCGPDGIWHHMAGQNLFTGPAWFLPAFLIARALSSPNYAISPVGAEKKDGIAVERVRIYREVPASNKQAAF